MAGCGSLVAGRFLDIHYVQLSYQSANGNSAGPNIDVGR